MNQAALLQISLGAILGLTLVLLAAGIRRRRHREWLIRLCQKYDLGLVESGVSRDAMKLASMYEAKNSRVRLRDILVGSDDDGRYFLAERRIGRRRDHVLFFEPDRGTHLHGFAFSPHKAKRRRFPWRRLRGAKSTSAAPSDAGAWTLQWSAPREQWVDERGLGVAARVLFHVAQVVEDAPMRRLQVEIEERRVILRCDRHLGGQELDRFLSDATRLRRRVLESLRRVRSAHRESIPRKIPAAGSTQRVRVLS